MNYCTEMPHNQALRAVRKQKRLSMRKVGEAVGVTSQCIELYERTGRGLRPELRERAMAFVLAAPHWTPPAKPKRMASTEVRGWVRQLREAQHMTQTKLAQIRGVLDEAVSIFERPQGSRQRVNPSTIASYWRALGVTVPDGWALDDVRLRPMLRAMLKKLRAEKGRVQTHRCRSGFRPVKEPA